MGLPEPTFPDRKVDQPEVTKPSELPLPPGIRRKKTPTQPPPKHTPKTNTKPRNAADGRQSTPTHAGFAKDLLGTDDDGSEFEFEGHDVDDLTFEDFYIYQNSKPRKLRKLPFPK